MFLHFLHTQTKIPPYVHTNRTFQKQNSGYAHSFLQLFQSHKKLHSTNTAWKTCWHMPVFVFLYYRFNLNLTCIIVSFIQWTFDSLFLLFPVLNTHYSLASTHSALLVSNWSNLCIWQRANLDLPLTWAGVKRNETESGESNHLVLLV
jgi:hypothetical protein